MLDGGRDMKGELLIKTMGKSYSKALKGFVKGSLTLIGLFFVLSCTVAVLLFYFDKTHKVCELIKVLTIPLIILLIFLLIVFLGISCMLKGLLKPEQGTENEGSFFDKYRIEMIIETYINTVSAINPDSVKHMHALHALFRDILKLYPNSKSEDKLEDKKEDKDKRRWFFGKHKDG
jgi:hypothetical protein